ncbi:MAG: glucosamine-6-phosphate deaminase, partial [Bacteroidetes bacterium]
MVVISESASSSKKAKTKGTSRERVPVSIFDNSASLSRQVASEIATLISENRAKGKRTVLGLPTGSTPIGVYQSLIQMYENGQVDFSDVITFNLDEYFPMEPDSLQSYHRFMLENFFNSINIPPENIHIPPGNIPEAKVEQFCAEYERAMADAGGIDLILLGIGRSGHIGFNEPGSGSNTRTRIITLDGITRKDAGSDFFGEENVPREAITMGVGTILDARRIILMATGEHKAPIVLRAVEGDKNLEISATFLQDHGNAAFYVDDAASLELTRIKTPWLVRQVEWSHELSHRAVIWLSAMVEKSIMRLDQGDFHKHGLHTLTYARPNIDELCREVFETLLKKIAYRDDMMTGKKIILFSPHPDDDVISMGGMLDTLVANGNEVTVAYMTNGSVAVFDADVRRYIRFMEMTGPSFGLDSSTTVEIADRAAEIREFLTAKSPGEVDTEQVQQIKAHIRYAEAISGIEVLGLSKDEARFLDMPFYKTGMVKKDPISSADISIVFDLLKELQPDHIFVAGDLSDPHGTHRMCYVAIEDAVKKYAEYTKGTDVKNPLIWLYRGAWQEWEIHQADIFLPMSKANLDRKIEAIFKHESQKDRAMFPGAYDSREFWER